MGLLVMTLERYKLINALADAVLELPADERARFLDESCAGDPELRMRVDRLLAAHESSAVLLEAPALEVLARDMATTPTDNDLTGKAVDGYRVMSRLGAGGHGEVWLARDEQLRRDVALKLLSRRFTGDPHHVRQRFQQEARTASTLNHPNIVTIYEIGNTEGLDFIAQEFVQGQTLRQWLANGPVALLSIVDVGVQVAAALTAAHGAGIIHRDIKPENIMVRPDGLVKVLDFGLARFVEREPLDREGGFSEELITRPGFVLGTARYMSPEQARGLTVDPRSDLFSLGVVLYEMVTGIAPFSGPTPSDVLAAILTRRPPPLSQYSPETPPELERIIRRCLEKDPQARYPGANELRRDLNHLRRHIEFPGEPTPSSDEVAALTSHPSEKTPSSAQEVAGIRRPRAAFLITLCSIAALLLALGIFQASRRGTTPSFSSMKINRVITPGDVADSAISTDGGYIGYVLNDERGQSLWITQLATGSEVRTIAPEPGQHTGLTFSPDGNYLYYRRKVGNGTFTLYRVPVLGGEPAGVTANVSGIAFAPDGREFAFFRIDPSNKASTLMVAHADGSGERKIETRRLPRYFSRYSLAWSPDGRWIACFAGDATSSSPEAFRLIAVRVADGVEKTISSRAWRWGGSLVWPTKGNSLLFDATENIEDGYQIWEASINNGEVSRLTNDLNDYTRLSLTSDAKTMLAVQTQQSADLWVAPAGDSSREVQITFGNLRGVESIAWTPEGRIVYSAQGSDYRNIWIMDGDGRNSKQLTAGPGDKVEAAVTRDGRYIVYQLGGKIWRSNIGGGSALQLTHGIMDVHPDPSADSQSVIYASFANWSPGIAGRPTLWKVSIDGGKPIQLSPAPASVPKVSPDGKLIAFEYFPGGDPQLSAQLVGLMSTEGGSPIKVLDRLPSVASRFLWAPDGKALQFAVLNQHVGNIWRDSLNGGPPAQITRFNTGQLFTFAWSQDGRKLAVARGKVLRDVVLIKNFN